MTKRVMLDTNIVFAIHHNRTKAFQRLVDFQNHAFLISSLVAVEVLVGAHPSQKSDTRKFLSGFQIMPFDENAVAESLRLAAKYFVDKSSKSYDLLIAAHALQLRVPLITTNTKDYTFSRLKVIDYNAL